MCIEFSDFSFRYASLDKPTLKNISLRIEQGEKIVIVGPSGSGKSTLGQCLNGLIPHAVKGEISGSLTLNGQACQKLSLHQVTEQVGTVLQDTDSQFVGLSVAEDIAFALENQLVPHGEMLEQVQKTAEMVDLESLLDKSPHDLSGGQKQRVSLAGVMVDDVDILLFDEPLAALDPKTGKAAIEIIDDLHKKSGKTVIIIEHRLEDVLHRPADRIVLIDNGQIQADMKPCELLHSPLLTKHGIREPLYLSAMKSAGCEINAAEPLAQFGKLDFTRHQSAIQGWFHQSAPKQNAPDAEALLALKQLNYSYDGEKNALEDISFSVSKGEVCAILGKNGSGKSTITKLVMGVLNPDQGSLHFDGRDMAEMTIFERSSKVGVVMQNPNHMISQHMIFDEVAFGLRNRGVDENTVKEKVLNVLELCGLSKYRKWPVEALSYGQKKRVTIASILVLEPELLILDEPTAGQDHRNYTSMLRFIRRLNHELGISVVIISHDMHLVLEYTDRAIVIADSKLIADAPVAKIFSQPGLLDRANLAPTSLYHLAEKAGIADNLAFIDHFISCEREAMA